MGGRLGVFDAGGEVQAREPHRRDPAGAGGGPAAAGLADGGQARDLYAGPHGAQSLDSPSGSFDSLNNITSYHSVPKYTLIPYQFVPKYKHWFD